MKFDLSEDDVDRIRRALRVTSDQLEQVRSALLQAGNVTKASEALKDEQRRIEALDRKLSVRP